MKRLLIAAVLVVSMAAGTPALGSNGVDKQPMTRHFTEAGDEASEVAGRSYLIRRADGLKASVQVDGLTAGGVYTFWWIVVQGEFPNWFVARGGSTIAGDNGKATVHMSAELGDAGIEGFGPSGASFTFDDLGDPLGATVHVEIAYHGQAADAGGSLATWQTDFWSGTACPNPFGINADFAGAVNAAGQPHCPVYVTATHG